MATGTKKKQKGSMASTHEHTQPDWPTTMRGRLPGGRVLGIDGSVWVYRTVELAPVEDAKTTVMQMEPAGPILAAFDELSAMAVVKTNRRATAKGTYRNVHLLLVNTPDSYRVPNDFPNADYLNTEFADLEIKRRLLLFGVQLRPALGSGGLRSAIDSATEFIMMRGTPMSDFDKDYAQVSSALSRAGLGTPTDQDFALANSWWSTRSDPATPFVPHPGHLHVFNTIRSAQSAAEHGSHDCSTWPKIEGQYVITMASVKDFSLPFTPATTPYSRWVDALRDQGALAVSIRGLVEPSSVTRSELRRRRRQYQEDIEERYKAQKMDRAEQTRLLAELTAVEAAYSDGGGVPTLVDTSVMVALNGSHPDLYESAANRAFTLTEMSYRQSAGIAETWLASNVRANPNLHDIPVHTIAFSGLPSLSKVGDRTGAQIGVTRKDRQPAFISHIAASRGDGLPIFGIFGQTGSGKTMTMLWLAHQFAKAGVPQVIFDPKENSDLSIAVQASGGRVASLDSLTESDGVLDPLRSAENPEAGLEAALAMIQSVNPWGDAANNHATALSKALRIGVNRGGTATGHALRIALEAGEPAEVIRPVLDLAESLPSFRACVGMDAEAPALRFTDGITLIKVGSNGLNLPAPGTPRNEMSQSQRSAMNLVRMVTVGSMRAMSGRDGVLHLDEAWTVLSAGKSEMDQIGRTARSLRVLPILYTQRCTDALKADLTGYISRVLILPMTDIAEAEAACLLGGLEPTNERIAALSAKATIGESPNWRSMRALRDPVTGKNLRGTIGFYCDLNGQAIPVEVKIPPSFLALASTNADDMMRRSMLMAKPQDANIIG